MIKVGIIGCGFVGGALKAWLEENHRDAKVYVSDPPKGYNDDLSELDLAFLQIHVHLQMTQKAEHCLSLR